MLSFDYHWLLSLLVIITLKNENKKALLTAKISNALCIYYNPIRKPLGLFRIIGSDSLLSFCYQIVLWRTANPHKYWVFNDLKWDEVKCHILKKAKSFILLSSLNISFFLNSARIFFFLALSFFLSSFQSSGRVLWQYENAIEYARFSLFLLLFPRSRLPVH